MVAFVASTVLTAAALNTAFNALTIRTVTLTSDTLVLADNGGAVTYSNASATTSTIPPNSSVAYAVGTKIVLANLGAGVVTVTAGSGVTVNGTLTIAQNAGGTCLKTATNTWSFLPFGSGAAAAVISSTTGSPTITTDGTATVYKFTGDGTLVVGTAGVATVTIVGGGGGGGSAVRGAGGGGGGLIRDAVVTLDAGTNTITVGAGGASGVYSANSAANQVGILGGYSRIQSLVAFGGGGGGGGLTGPTFGGSGGGGNEGFAAALGVTGQGNSGGAGANAPDYFGGGGGAGAVGGNSNVQTGGDGLTSAITGTSIYYGGGGSASNYNANDGHAGGQGGGGVGRNANGTTVGQAPMNGTVNLGGGGGSSGNGGSGVVIVRVG